MVDETAFNIKSVSSSAKYEPAQGTQSQSFGCEALGLEFITLGTLRLTSDSR